jgi:uncharacterized lipoprotein YddW (UPF0748 family)
VTGKKIALCLILMISVSCRVWAGETPTRFGLFVRGASNFMTPDAAEELLDFCASTGVDTLFVRVYTNDQCLFRTDAYNSDYFLRVSVRQERDPLRDLIDQARQRGIDVHAWIITYGFSRSALDSHLLVREHGTSVLTRDQYGNLYDGRKTGHEREQYYMRDRLCWLEPGDPRVSSYLHGMIEELADNYPGLSGVLFDFIRYPSDVPFVPGARYSKWGYSPGYGEESVRRFVEMHGYPPDLENLAMEYEDAPVGMYRALAWDRWRRAQITEFLAGAGDLLKKRGMRISSSVFAYADRLYFHGFQNWRGWIEQNVVDFVVLMSYSVDDEMVYYIAKQHVTTYPESVWIALAAYLYGGNRFGFQRQMNQVLEVSPPGLAFYVYDQMREHPDTLIRE